MQNDLKKDEFKVDHFEPVKLKEAREALERHMLRVQMHGYTNETYKKGLLKESTLWEKIVGLFKR